METKQTERDIRVFRFPWWLHTFGVGAENRFAGQITANLWNSVNRDFQIETSKQVRFLHLETNGTAQPGKILADPKVCSTIPGRVGGRAKKKSYAT
jgi:hypothetical protein